MITFSEERSLRDETIDLGQLGRYKMCLALDPRNFYIAAFDTRNDRCIAYEHYRCNQLLDTPESAVEPLRQLLGQHSFWRVGYWQKIVFMIADAPFAFIPEAYFEAENAVSYLRLNGTPNLKTSYIQYTEHHNFGATCLFTVPKAISNWLENAYPSTSISYAHQLSAIIEGLRLQGTTKSELQVFIEEKEAVIAMVEGSELEFINRFPYRTPNELLYFILAVSQQRQLDAPPIRLYGSHAQDEAINELLAKYISEIGLGTRPERLFFGKSFEKLPPTQNFDLLSSFYIA
jgi:hypothetical protein